MLFHGSRNWGRVLTWTTNEDDIVQVVHINTSEISPPWPLLFKISWTSRSISRWFSAIMKTLNSSVKVRLLCQRYTTKVIYTFEYWTGSDFLLFHLSQTRQTKAVTEPVSDFIQYGHNEKPYRRNNVLYGVRIRKLCGFCRANCVKMFLH